MKYNEGLGANKQLASSQTRAINLEVKVILILNLMLRNKQ